MAMMSVKLLSVLLSLAMMLTGTYGVEAPQEAARTLTLSNVTLTVNGESVTLEPSLSLGVATDGAKALYTAAVHSGGSALFPVQLSVTEEALTALVKNADTAFTVPASAIDALTGTLAETATQSAGDEAGSVTALLTFYSQEYIPAYTRVLQKAMDPEFAAQLRQKSQALMEEMVDRGEGQPGSVEIDGTEYDCLTYHYTMDVAQLMALADAVYTLDEDLGALYDVIFKLYDMLPEESGLKGLHSFADVAEKTGMNLTAEYTESVANDAEASLVDTVVTLDLSAMVAITSDSQTTDLSDAAAIAPMVINSTTTQVGDVYRSTASMDYTMESGTITVNASSSQDAEGFALTMDMGIDAGEEGGMTFVLDATRTETAKQLKASMDFKDNSTQFKMTADAQVGANADNAGRSYSMELAFDSENEMSDSIRLVLTADGETQGDGGSHNAVALDMESNSVTATLSCDLDVTTDAIEEAASSREALVIEDLSNLNDLMTDEAGSGKLMQAVGSFMTDAGTLSSEASITSMGEQIEKAYNALSGYDEGMTADEERASSEEPVDDGVLSFEEPRFAYLPEGWKIVETEKDTAYDQVTVSIADATYENNLYATFSSGASQTENFVMDGEGKLVPAETQDVQVEKSSDSSWMATVIHGDVGAQLYFMSESLTLDEIAQIINGLTF